MAPTPKPPLATAPAAPPSSGDPTASDPTDLAGVSAKDYGEGHSEHLLEQYTLYVQMADKISDRRQAANSYAFALNTALVTVLAALLSRQAPWLPSAAPLMVCVCGIILCLTWHRLLRSYRDLNSAKFKVVHEMERLLPVRPYDCEWSMLGRGKMKALYHPLSHIESYIPLVFATLYVAIIVVATICDTR